MPSAGRPPIVDCSVRPLSPVPRHVRALVLLSACAGVALGPLGCGSDSQPTVTNAPAELTEPSLTPEPTSQPALEPATQPATQPAVDPAVLLPTPPVTRPTASSTTAPATQAFQAPDPMSLPITDFIDRQARASQSDEAVADLLAGEARRLSAQPDSPAARRKARALMEAAVRLDPTDTRLARQFINTTLEIGDTQAALAALQHYRALRPGEQLAQIQFIDLTVNAMETAEDRLAYLRQIVETQAVPNPVRSHAATSAATLLSDRMRDDEAEQMLARALELDDLNPAALQLEYARQLRSGATAPERIATLLQLLRSNVAQPAVAARLAELLAQEGLSTEAVAWYRRAYDIQQAAGSGLDLTDARGYATQLAIDNRPQAAAAVAAQLVEQEPDATDARLLLLLAQKASGNLNDELINPVRTALVQRINVLHDAIAEQKPATPADLRTELPDVVADAKKLVEDRDPSNAIAYANALADLAWLDVYFRQQPAGDKVLAALEELLGNESPASIRLEGWSLWRAGDLAGARQKLATVAEQDVTSRLGLLLIEAEGEGRINRQKARDLLASNPSGLVGAFIADAVRPVVAKVPAGPNADAIYAELSEFPERIFDVLKNEHVRNFYTLQADPLKVTHQFAEPLLANVRLQNTGEFPITVGPGGLIRPELRFDAQLKGVIETSIPLAAQAQMRGNVRLNPSEGIEMIVRVDGPQLADALARQPYISVPMFFTVTSNPILIPTEQGLATGVGAAGYGSKFRRVISREGAPLQDSAALTETLERLRTGDGATRVRTAELVSTYLQLLAEQVEAGTAPEGADQLAATLEDALRRAAASERDPATAAWMSRLVARLGQPADRVRVARDLLDEEAYLDRLIGLTTLAELPPEQRVELAQPLAESDPDPTVRRYAAAVVDEAQQ